jgi:hypothetical protein
MRLTLHIKDSSWGLSHDVGSWISPQSLAEGLSSSGDSHVRAFLCVTCVAPE